MGGREKGQKLSIMVGRKLYRKIRSVEGNKETS